MSTKDGGPSDWLMVDLRDYFAAAALQGMLCNGFMPRAMLSEGYTYERAAYAIADDMLKARES